MCCSLQIKSVFYGMPWKFPICMNITIPNYVFLQNPVYVYDTLPNSVINENRALATLTNKDIGVVISSPNGYLAVVYYVQSPSDGALVEYYSVYQNCIASFV